jgi:hypothetical protein
LFDQALWERQQSSDYTEKLQVHHVQCGASASFSAYAAFHIQKKVTHSLKLQLIRETPSRSLGRTPVLQTRC